MRTPIPSTEKAITTMASFICQSVMSRILMFA
jgi:hypothetical protein